MMKRITALILAMVLVFSLAACGGKAEPETEINPAEQQETEPTEQQTAEPADTSEPIEVKGDPVEYEQSYWEEKYPDYMFCPFSIVEDGIEKSYYWPMGYEGLDGTIATWIECPFNWNGWHKTADGCIVNEDETLKITDDWANGDESMSSCCTVTTEKYEK